MRLSENFGLKVQHFKLKKQMSGKFNGKVELPSTHNFFLVRNLQIFVGVTSKIATSCPAYFLTRDAVDFCNILCVAIKLFFSCSAGYLARINTEHARLRRVAGSTV